MKPPTHDVLADGSWKCGGCGTVNGLASKCAQCHIPFYSLVTTAAPANKFCSRCGFLNDGDNFKCVQCDYTIRSTLDKISSNLQDSTNFLARDMGVNVHVKCPICFVVCYVPPATVCLRCGTCHTYFASPSVEDVTSFHLTRLASSISSSFMSFFGGKRSGQETNERRQENAREAPVGKLIAAGQDVANSSRQLSTSAYASQSSASLQLHNDSEVFEDKTEEEADSCQIEEQNNSQDQLGPKRAKLEAVIQTSSNSDEVSSLHSDHNDKVKVSLPDLSCSSNSSKAHEHPMLARPMPVRAALPPPRQELVEVEGDIVEL